MEHKLTQTEKLVLTGLGVLLGLAMLSGMISCTPNSNVPKKKTTFQIDNEINPVEVVVIDSCEYFYGPWGNATVLTHKGNCKNPIHTK